MASGDRRVPQETLGDPKRPYDDPHTNEKEEEEEGEEEEEDEEEEGRRSEDKK